MEGIMKGIVKEKEEMGAVYRRDLKIPESVLMMFW